MQSGLSVEILESLPGLNCGVCGFKTCAELAERAVGDSSLLERCIQRKEAPKAAVGCASQPAAACGPCAGCGEAALVQPGQGWRDSLGRDFDFVLEAFPNELGPREIIIPHNPARTADLGIKKGDVLIGRPMGMSCGCPITHCGVATAVDPVNGVITWCVTGPLRPRSGEHKDMGYYSAQAYEGIVTRNRADIKIGLRYFFMPHRCMLQWRHSGLVNFINRSPGGLQVRVEGLYIG